MNPFLRDEFEVSDSPSRIFCKSLISPFGLTE